MTQDEFQDVRNCIRDAMRYRFIRCHVTKKWNGTEDGKYSWRFVLDGFGRHMRGPTFDDAVDAAIEEMQKELQERCG